MSPFLPKELVAKRTFLSRSTEWPFLRLVDTSINKGHDTSSVRLPCLSSGGTRNGRIPALNRQRIILLPFFLAVFLLGIAGQAKVSGQGDLVFVATVDGIINPVSQRHITRTIEKGEKEGASLVVILLNTPGGLLSSTRKISESLLNARVPTVVYVAPHGAQAMSAGTFITASAHFAAMAPGTTIGSATPIGSSGEDLPKTLANKATNAAAADMRAIATTRGRNSQKLEETVVRATSFSADEAVELNIVDLRAQDINDLLKKLNGREITINNHTYPLNTRDVTISKQNMGLIDQFLSIIADPNISFLLLSIGGLGIAIEVLNPGLIFPGVAGIILLVLAFASLGNLPVNWAGAILILLAWALFIAEFYASGFGILGVGGITSFTLGGFFLFSHFGSPSPTNPSVGVSLWIIILFTTLLTILGAWVIITIARPKRMQRSLDRSPLVGAEGIATSNLAPRGLVRIGFELWTAETSYGSIIELGERVRVIGVEGTILRVVPMKYPAK